MKRVIVIIMVLLLVAGGGAGGLIMLGIVPDPFNPKTVAMSAAEHAAAEASKSKFQPPAAVFSLVKVPDMIIPVIVNGRVERRVFITCRVMSSAKEHEKEIKESVKHFQGEVITDFVPFLQTYYAQHDALDLILIKQKLLGHAKHVFGDDVVKDVLLINLFDQTGGSLPTTWISRGSTASSLKGPMSGPLRKRTRSGTLPRVCGGRAAFCWLNT